MIEESYSRMVPKRPPGEIIQRPVWLPQPPQPPPPADNNNTKNPSSNSGPYRPQNFTTIPYHPPPPIFDNTGPRRVRRWTDTPAAPVPHIERDHHQLHTQQQKPLIPPPPTSLSLTTSERYRRSKELAADAETGYMAGGGGGQGYRPYGGQEYRIVKENDRRVKLASGLGPTEDEEWKIANDKAQRMRFYAEQVRQTNDQRLQTSNESRLHTGYWKNI